MSVFKTQTSNMETNITGETLGLRINNAIPILLKDLFGLGTSEFDELLEDDPTDALAKLVVATFKANHIETTVEEVIENTTFIGLNSFYAEYIATQYTLPLKKETEESNENSEEKSRHRL